jgi:hypothetical protein
LMTDTKEVSRNGRERGDRTRFPSLSQGIGASLNVPGTSLAHI